MQTSTVHSTNETIEPPYQAACDAAFTRGVAAPGFGRMSYGREVPRFELQCDTQAVKRVNATTCTWDRLLLDWGVCLHDPVMTDVR